MSRPTPIADHIVNTYDSCAFAQALNASELPGALPAAAARLRLSPDGLVAFADAVAERRTAGGVTTTTISSRHGAAMFVYGIVVALELSGPGLSVPLDAAVGVVRSQGQSALIASNCGLRAVATSAHHVAKLLTARYPAAPLWWEACRIYESGLAIGLAASGAGASRGVPRPIVSRHTRTCERRPKPRRPR